MLSSIRSLLRRKPPQIAPPAPPVSRSEKYDLGGAQSLLRQQREDNQRQVDAFIRSVSEAARTVRVEGNIRGAMDAMDSSENGLPGFKAVAVESSQSLMALMPWYMRQGFIGYQNAAFLAQHWLIHKACATPIDDAIRNGYDITTDTGEDLPQDALKLLKRADRRMGIKGHLRDFGTKGRIFGARIALFQVKSEDPEYYEKPFNIDGVGPGSYKGISQTDPYWTAPILDITSAATPSSQHFYEPTWWLIGSQRIHRSHLVIFRYADPPDVLKPLYLFGGIPLPQMIMERVYAAERTANEAPALALSKRTTVWLTDTAKMMADSQQANGILQNWIAWRDNFGIKVGDKEGDQFQQFDTPLADFDQLIMSQYGLVAATAGMPITKLLGTTPGGFAATGEYDEASYHELLESMQERDLTPLVERHHELVMRSIVLPKFKDLTDTQIVVEWHETDAVTHKEKAEENLIKAQTGAALVASGAIDSQIEHDRVAADKESGYHGIGDAIDVEELPDDDPADAAGAAGEARHGAEAAVKVESSEKTTRLRSKGVLSGKAAA